MQPKMQLKNKMAFINPYIYFSWYTTFVFVWHLINTFDKYPLLKCIYPINNSRSNNYSRRIKELSCTCCSNQVDIKYLINGYRTLNPNPVANEQPLYTQDFANDKEGLVVNNKGEVKAYTNMGINESQKRNWSSCIH